MNEIEQRKEIFAWFGAAVYYVQCFEVELTILLCYCAIFKDKNLAPENMEEIDTKLSKKTLGFLIKELKKHLEIAPELENLLNKYLQKRNYLIHHYFYENSMRMLSCSARGKMLNELKSLSNTFKEANLIAEKMSKNLRKILGIDEGKIQTMVSRFIEKEREIIE